VTRPVRLACFVSAALIVAAIYTLRVDRVVGLMLDDGWYVLLAKSLASGQGYRLINAPASQIMPLYPPGFPFLLSLAFRVLPSFPANLWLLKMVSVVAMVGTGVLTFVYCTRHRGFPQPVGFLVALAVTLAPPLVFFATSTVMSEVVFMAALLAAVLAVERSARTEVRGWPWLSGLLGSLLVSGALLVRMAGVALPLAVVAYLLVRRRIRDAALIAAGVVLFVGPWVLYARAQAPTDEQRREQNGHIVEPYSEQFWQRSPGNRLSGRDRPADLPARVWRNLRELATDSTAELVAMPALHALRRSELGAWLAAPVTLLIAVGLLAGMRRGLSVGDLAFILSLGVALLWPFPQARLALPLLPFQVIYLVAGVRALVRLLGRVVPACSDARAWAAAAAVATCVLAVNLHGNLAYIWQVYGRGGVWWLESFDEHRATCEWMRDHLAPGDAVATNDPPLLYLFSGLETVAIDSPEDNWERWKRIGVRYLVRSPLWEPPLPPELEDGPFAVIHRSSGRLGIRVIDLGPPAARGSWSDLVRRRDAAH